MRLNLKTLELNLKEPSNALLTRSQLNQPVLLKWSDSDCSKTGWLSWGRCEAIC